MTRLMFGGWVRRLAGSDFLVERKGGDVGVLERVC